MSGISPGGRVCIARMISALDAAGNISCSKRFPVPPVPGVPPAIGIRNFHPNSVGDCAAIKLPVLKDILSDTYRFSKHFVELSLRV